METLVLLGSFLYIAAAGFWIMGRLDRFLGGGGVLRWWDKSEEKAAVSKAK